MMLCGTAWIVNPRLCLGAAPASPVKRRRMKPPETLRCDEPPLASGPPEAVALDVWINTPSIREVAHTRTSRVRIVQATLDSVAVDAFAIVLLGAIAALVLWVWLL